MTDDAELLRRYVAEHDQAAFAELVGRHLGLVYHTALRQVAGDRHRAEDVAQGVFTDLARKAGSLLQYPSLGGWLYARSRYGGMQAMRTQRRRQKREERAHLMSEIDGKHASPVEWNELRPLIDDALHSLSECDRNAVCLRILQDRPFSEVGSRLGLSEEAARKRVQRATEKMRRSLQRRGVQSTAAAIEVALASYAGAAAPAGMAEGVAAAALAAVGTPAAGSLKLFQLMTTSKAALGVATLAGFIGLFYAAREHTRLGRMEAALASARHQYESTQIQIQGLRTRVKRAQQDLAVQAKLRSEAEQALTRQPRNTVAAAHHGSEPPALDRHPPPINRVLKSNPEVKKLFAAWVTAFSKVMYGPFFKSSGLSASQVDALEQLIQQHDVNVNGLAPGTGTLNLRPDGVSEEDLQQSIHSLLGDTGFQQYTQFQQTLFVRSVANGLAGNLYDTDTPLSPHQADQLSQILVQSSSGQPNGAPPFPGDVNWTSALTQAQGVLSAPQMAIFQSLVTVVSGQSGIWGGLFSPALMEGATGMTTSPPASFWIQSPPK